jgi:hypothetical protein
MIHSVFLLLDIALNLRHHFPLQLRCGKSIIMLFQVIAKRCLYYAVEHFLVSVQGILSHDRYSRMWRWRLDTSLESEWTYGKTEINKGWCILNFN